MSWRDAAACRRHPHPEWWLDGIEVAQAVAICRRCPVLEDCSAHYRRLFKSRQIQEVHVGMVLAGRKVYRKVGREQVVELTEVAS